MTDFFNQDFGSIPEEHATGTDLPPLIQWRRGDRESGNELLAGGCFELPADRYEVADMETVGVMHKGESKPAYLFKGLHMAVIGWRKDWFTGQGDDRKPVNNYDPNVRAWSRIQAQVLVKELGGELFMITFSGSNSIGFENALQQFRQEVVAKAQVKAKRKFPLYAFWMPVGPDDIKEFKKHGTWATPPKLYLKTPVEKDETIANLYVGNELALRGVELFDEVKAWAERDFSQPQPHQQAQDDFDGNGGFDGGMQQEQPGGFEGDEIPF